jgi:hypothetical protein
MSRPIEILDPDIWPALRRRIEERRAECIEGLMQTTPEALRGNQQYIAALDWVLEEAKPKIFKDQESIYDDDC